MMGIFMSLLNLTKGHNKYIFLNIRNGKSMLNDENIISKSRSIIDLRNVNFTIQEFRLMEVYLSKINPQDETTASVTFTKQEYCDLMEIQSRLLESKRLNKYMQHLFNNSVTEWLEDGESFEMHPLFEKAKFDKKNSTITLECGKSDYVRKMFFDISKNGYIKYALKNTLYLQSVYSIKLYLYLLENRFRSTWKIELDCLKGIFECTSDYYNVILYMFCGIVLNSWVLPLYSVVACFAALKTIDFVVEGIDRAKCAMIVTEYPTEICEALSNTFGSGVTRVDATGGYSKRNKSIVYFV